MRVVIADDAPLIREGVTRLLTENAVEVVAQVGDADALLVCVRDLRPDVALIDVRMPPTYTDEGLRAAHEIRSHYPGTAVLVLSQHLEPEYAMRLIDERPERAGYLMKERSSCLTRWNGSQRAGVSSTGLSSRSSSRDGDRSTRSRGSRRTSGRSSA
jgi:DNA-binding NarL/FixJ family response regulator